MPSQALFYGAAAIFSITPCTEEQAIEYERRKHGGWGHEEWVSDVLALPAPVESGDDVLVLHEEKEL